MTAPAEGRGDGGLRTYSGTAQLHVDHLPSSPLIFISLVHLFEIINEHETTNIPPACPQCPARRDVLQQLQGIASHRLFPAHIRKTDLAKRVPLRRPLDPHKTIPPVLCMFTSAANNIPR